MLIPSQGEMPSGVLATALKLILISSHRLFPGALHDRGELPVLLLILPATFCFIAIPFIFLYGNRVMIN